MKLITCYLKQLFEELQDPEAPAFVGRSTRHNYVLNPQHPQFGNLTVGEAEPFSFDPRLRGS